MTEINRGELGLGSCCSERKVGVRKFGDKVEGRCCSFVIVIKNGISTTLICNRFQNQDM